MKPGPKTKYDKISRYSDSDVTNANCEDIFFFWLYGNLKLYCGRKIHHNTVLSISYQVFGRWLNTNSRILNRTCWSYALIFAKSQYFLPQKMLVSWNFKTLLLKRLVHKSDICYYTFSLFNARKVSVFGFFLLRIFLHSDSFFVKKNSPKLKIFHKIVRWLILNVKMLNKIVKCPISHQSFHKKKLPWVKHQRT